MSDKPEASKYALKQARKLGYSTFMANPHRSLTSNPRTDNPFGTSSKADAWQQGWNEARDNFVRGGDR